MRIGICDDEERDRKQVAGICREVLEKCGETYELIEFEDGRTVARGRRRPDILILDIEMPGLDGISLKQQMQTDGDETVIIFISGHRELSRELIGVHVFDFITKDLLQQQLPAVLEAAVDWLDKTVSIDGICGSGEVLFLKAEHVYARVFLRNGEEQLVRKSMKELEKQLLPAGYLRVHREYLVNMKWIDNMDKNKLSIGGIVLPISARLGKQVQKTYKDYQRRKAGFC